MRFVLIAYSAVLLLGVTACGASQDAGGGSGARSGSGGSASGGAGSGGAAGTAGGKAGSASAGSSGSAGGPALPADTVVLGPFGLSGSLGSSGDDQFVDVSIPVGGHALFHANGVQTVGASSLVDHGLLLPPAESALGASWLCTGPGATWTPTATDDTSDCVDSRCDYTLLLPEPSRLTCAGASTTGTLEFSPVAIAAGVTSTLTASLGALDDIVLSIGRGTTLAPTPSPAPAPSFIQYSESGAGSTARSLALYFTATEVPAPAGEPITAWTLSDVSVVYRPSGYSGPFELLCATGGTYTISESMPVQHAVTVTGVSEPLSCPGSALETPVALLLER